jgi:CRP-like cAMP-binding protein
LVQALRAQKAVGQESAVALALARSVVLAEFQRGRTLIKQDASDNTLYFLLSGSVAVLVNGREIATRAAGEHVGEMALLDPGARRSATVVATEPTVTARITERSFSAVADRYPRLWRAIAAELGQRLRQRGRSLCANMNETLPPSEFRVEGGEGMRDERPA